MDRIIIIDDKGIKDDLEAFLIANQEHIRLNSDMDEVSLSNNPTLQEIIALYEKKYKVKIRSRDNIRFYRLNDIVSLKAQKNQTMLYLINGKTNVIKEPLDDIALQLKDFPFYRTHKNYMVNLHHITGIMDQDKSKVIMSTNETIPLADREKQVIIETLNKFIQ